jgi:hypothetical protein
VPVDPSAPRRTLVLRLVPLRKAPTLSVVLPDHVESAPEPYVRPAHMAPPSGPSLHLAQQAGLAG